MRAPSVTSPTFLPGYTFGGAGLVSYPRTLTPPTGFGWTPSFSVIESKPGRFTTDLDEDALKVATNVTRYVNLARPNNAGDGLSWANADKSIWAAINAISDTTTLYILGSADPDNPTVYDYDNAWRSNLAFDANVIVVSDTDTLAPGYAITSTYMAPGGADLGTWALTADPAGPNVYEATLAAAPNAVIDATVTSAFGAATRLTSRASIALVEANPGSWYHDGTKLYVRTVDSRAPDASLRALKASVVNGHTNSSSADVYIKGLTFEGGNARCYYMQAIHSATLIDCKATHGQAEGLSLSSSTASLDATVYLIRCSALDCDADGFQYTGTGASSAIRVLEVDCEATGNSGAGTDQGSSAHFTAGNTAVSVIRIGGHYHANKPDGIADVGGCDTWMLGTRIDGEAIGFYCGDTSTAWLHRCVVTGSSGTADLVPDNASGAIHLAGTVWGTKSGAGTVDTYTP